MSRTSTPLLPPSKQLPSGFGASLGIWWSNSSYKEARIAEQRLLRRMPMFRPAQAAGIAVEAEGNESMRVRQAGEEDDGLVATIRNVYIPTPDPTQAPAHPADRAMPQSTGPTTPTSKRETGRRSPPDGKLVDYSNTLEISTPGTRNSKEAVVISHGYAAALGYISTFPSPSESAKNHSGSTFATGNPGPPPPSPPTAAHFLSTGSAWVSPLVPLLLSSHPLRTHPLQRE